MQKSDIEALLTARISESRTLDYKENLGDLGTEKAKLDLLCDVAAFANTAGGSILVGVTEARDDRNQQTGIPEAALGLTDFNYDAEISRIDNILATGIEPRVSIDPEQIDGFPQGPILVLHISQSWTGPHMVRNGRFYARDNTGKKLMDYHMIRNSFVSFLSLNSELRSFQRERVKAIFDDRTPLHLDPGPRLVIHALPVSAFVPATRRSIPLNELQKHTGKVCFRDVFRGRANLDGLLVPHKSESGSTEYVQMFRSGIMERVHSGFTFEKDKNPVVIGDDIIKIMRSGISGFLATQRCLGIAPPIVVMVAIMGVVGHMLAHRSSDVFYLHLRGRQTFDRDEFVLPEMIWEDLTAPIDPLIQELLTIFWQAGGIDEGPAPP